MDIFVLPWEPLPDLPESASGQRVWDGYFPWVWSSSGAAVSEDACWSRVTTREQYIQRLRDYYAMCHQVQKQGRIESVIGAVCPGFDDHKGQAWGEGLKRHLPRDNGQTLADTWAELKRADVDAALIITWNDWVESSQIEPSLELGDSELIACADQIVDWKCSSYSEELLKLPRRLLDARRLLGLCVKALVPKKQIAPVAKQLDHVACAIAADDASQAGELLDAAEGQLAILKSRLSSTPIHPFWEFGFDSIGIQPVTETRFEKIAVGDFAGIKLGAGLDRVGFVVDDNTRRILQRGHFVGRLCLEYLDTGTDFVRVLVDAASESHCEIASIKKTGSGNWRTASVELVNVRWTRGLENDVDFCVSQRPGAAGGVRGIRIDGVHYAAGSDRKSS